MAVKTKIFKTSVGRFESNLWGHHAQVPIEIRNYFHKEEITRFIGTINESLSFPCAILPHGKDYYFIYLNKPTRKKLKLELGDEITVQLEPDTSEYGMPVPEEMRELLLQDVEGEAAFQKLTPGKKRSLLYMVGKLKSPDKRLEKAIIIIDYLKMTGGKLDYEELKQAFKDNKRF